MYGGRRSRHRLHISVLMTIRHALREHGASVGTIMNLIRAKDTNKGHLHGRGSLPPS